MLIFSQKYVSYEKNVGAKQSCSYLKDLQRVPLPFFDISQTNLVNYSKRWEFSKMLQKWKKKKLL